MVKLRTVNALKKNQSAIKPPTQVPYDQVVPTY